MEQLWRNVNDPNGSCHRVNDTATAEMIKKQVAGLLHRDRFHPILRLFSSRKKYAWLEISLEN